MGTEKLFKTSRIINKNSFLVKVSVTHPLASKRLKFDNHSAKCVYITYEGRVKLLSEEVIQIITTKKTSLPYPT